MNTLSWIWYELTRPRGHVRHRFYRVGRSSRAGVALLMVLSSIMLLTILVTEIAHGATIRLRLAAHHRDEVRAEALAETGIQLYRLILMASKQLGRNPMIMEYGAMMGLNADTLWQMVPFINTGLMRMIFVSGGDIDKEEAVRMKAAGLSEEERDESREGRRNFLDFDGDFSASVQDESRFIYVGKLQAASFADLLELPATQEILGLMAKEEVNDYFFRENIDKMEIIGNLVDWTDADDVRLYQGGDEIALYDQLDSPYKTKNAPFDSIHEIRLVDGWHLDGVWERLGRHLTIYGAGKINVNTAHRPVMRAILAAFIEGYTSEQYIDNLLDLLKAARGTPLADGGVHFSSAQSFKGWVERELGVTLKDTVLQAVTTESEVFRIESVGEVGDSRVEIKAIIDYSTNPIGQFVYWKVE